jgi:hypothetical protein
MTARKKVVDNDFTPRLTKQILKLTEGQDANYSIRAIKLALAVLTIELNEHQPFILYPDKLIPEQIEGKSINRLPI